MSLKTKPFKISTWSENGRKVIVREGPLSPHMIIDRVIGIDEWYKLGSSWSTEEIEELIDLWNQGKGPGEIARILGRTVSAINHKRYYLRLRRDTRK